AALKQGAKAADVALTSKVEFREVIGTGLKMPVFEKVSNTKLPEMADNYLLAKQAEKDAFIAKGVSQTNLKVIDNFIKGKKKFDEVIEDYAKVYKEHVDSNKPWSWDDNIPGGDSLSSAQKRKIKEMAVEIGHIPEIKVTKVDGMKFGFADFAGAGVVEETVQLPEKFWKLLDEEQFKWLDEQIGGMRNGMTWHHTEVPGKMELVPFGIHNITAHNGGRTKGMWADAPR
ncbi:MAG: HNH endonuclease, partial [Longicatena sp.]